MKRIIISLLCAAAAPLAQAQSPTPTNTATASATATASPVRAHAQRRGTTASGTVKTHTYGKSIVINENNNPVTYLYGKTVHYVDKAGKEIDRHVIEPGKRVILHYTGTGKNRRVERVEVED